MNERARLLLVDDEGSSSVQLRDYLRAHGFEVAQAGSSGRQVPAAMERERPDVVLLDVDRAGDDGLLLARQLREH